MTRKFDGVGRAARRDLLSGAPDVRDGARPHVLPRRSFDVPGDLDLAIILTGRAVDTFEEVLQRKAKFAVIFAAGFSETGKDGEQARGAASTSSCASGDVRLLGPNTNLNAFEDFRADLDGPSIALITQSRPPGPARVPGPGDRHPAHALGADRQRGRPRVRRLRRATSPTSPKSASIACYIEGLQGRPHADARGRPRREAAQADRDGEGRPHRRRAQSMAQSHTGHLTGSDAVTSAVFRQFGVTRVDGLDELLDVSTAFARTRPTASPAWAQGATRPGRLRLRDLGRHRRAHGRHARRRRARAPRPHEGDADGAARRPDPVVPARVEPRRLRRPARRRRARAARSST